MRKLTIFTLLVCTLIGCNSTNERSAEKNIFVSITPLKALVEEITCGDFHVEVLVPEGASPESYEPSARQLSDINNAEALYAIGLIDFERSIIERLSDNIEIIDLSQGIEIMEGCCSHGHHHSHGVDPHIWTSLRSLHTMVETIDRTIMARYPDSAKYHNAAQELIARIDTLDARCGQMIADAEVTAMMIYHPAYTYYAKDYGIEQIAIEHDGKEPTPRQIASLIEQAKELNIRTLLRQPQYSDDKMVAIATECNADIVVTDPLASDILSEIERVTNIICNNDEQ